MKNTGKAYCDSLRVYFLPVLLCLLLGSCSLEDDRDLCCEVNRVRFRYLYRDTDRFAEYIGTVRYFLFDGEGCYLREMKPEEGTPESVSIATLPPGSYRLVAVGNLDDWGSLKGFAEEGLEAFHLVIDGYHPSVPDAFANGDRLYWGECPFTTVAGASNDFLGEMSNVHCVLRVRVEWSGLPEFADGYRFRLEGVGTGMELCGSRSDTIGVHCFPPVATYRGCLVEDVPLRRLSLDASLVTLRWTDGEIPRFRLYHGDTPVTKEVELGPVFQTWGWYPARAPVQEYAIRILIRPDGSIQVNQGIDGSVSDWEEGGTIG